MERRNGAVIRQLANQLLSKSECKVLKKALTNFREKKSVTSFCTALKPIITDPERTLILVELSFMIPKSLQDDFDSLCNLEFKYYQQIACALRPGLDLNWRTKSPKVIAQNETGSMKVFASHTGKSLVCEGEREDGSNDRVNDKESDSTDSIKKVASSVSDTESHNNNQNSKSHDSHDDNDESHVVPEMTNQNDQNENRRKTCNTEQILEGSGEHRKVDEGTKPPGMRFRQLSDVVVERIERLPHENNLSPNTSIHQENENDHRTRNTLEENQVAIVESVPVSAGSVPGEHQSNEATEYNIESSNNQHFQRERLYLPPDVRKIILQKRAGESLGFCIRGGREMRSGIFVSDVDIGGQAEQKGLLVGDRILRVNETSFRKIGHQEAVNVIKKCQQSVKLYVTSAQSHRMPSHQASYKNSPRNVQTSPDGSVKYVTIYAEVDGYLGIVLRGGIDQGREVSIASVDRDSPAWRAGIKRRDRILKLNGFDVSDMTHMEVVTLATSSSEVHMTIQPYVHRSQNTAHTVQKASSVHHMERGWAYNRRQRMAEMNNISGEMRSRSEGDLHVPLGEEDVDEYSPPHLRRPEEIQRYEQHLQRTPPVNMSTPLPTNTDLPRRTELTGSLLDQPSYSTCESSEMYSAYSMNPEEAEINGGNNGATLKHDAKKIQKFLSGTIRMNLDVDENQGAASTKSPTRDSLQNVFLCNMNSSEEMELPDIRVESSTMPRNYSEDFNINISELDAMADIPGIEHNHTTNQMIVTQDDKHNRLEYTGMENDNRDHGIVLNIFSDDEVEIEDATLSTNETSRTFTQTDSVVRRKLPKSDSSEKKLRRRTLDDVSEEELARVFAESLKKA